MRWVSWGDGCPFSWLCLWFIPHSPVGLGDVSKGTSLWVPFASVSSMGSAPRASACKLSSYICCLWLFYDSQYILLGFVILTVRQRPSSQCCQSWLYRRNAFLFSQIVRDTIHFKREHLLPSYSREREERTHRSCETIKLMLLLIPRAREEKLICSLSSPMTYFWF